MTWVVLLAAASGFTGGWSFALWQCSKRSNCPKYTKYKLRKWKREEELALLGRSSPNSPTPPEGGEIS